MKYSVEYTSRFRKSLKLCQKRGLNLDLAFDVIKTLELTGTLPAKYKPHLLKGKYSGLWECHIKPDWLLVWMQNDERLTLLFTDTGTHSDLFG